MTPVTTDRPVIHDATALLQLSRRELDELFAAAPVGKIPVGRGQGTAIIAPGTVFSTVARNLIRWFVWKGKVFRPGSSDLKNRLTPLGIPLIRAKVYVASSWKVPTGEAIILDYSKTSLVAFFIRDEIRQVGPGIYLGKVFIGKKHLLDFSLAFPQS
jgi:hypothetical protein